MNTPSVLFPISVQFESHIKHPRLKLARISSSRVVFLFGEDENDASRVAKAVRPQLLTYLNNDSQCLDVCRLNSYALI